MGSNHRYWEGEVLEQLPLKVKWHDSSEEVIEVEHNLGGLRVGDVFGAMVTLGDSGELEEVLLYEVHPRWLRKLQRKGSYDERKMDMDEIKAIKAEFETKAKQEAHFGWETSDRMKELMAAEILMLRGQVVLLSYAEIVKMWPHVP
jgi:hypothetical protein